MPLGWHPESLASGRTAAPGELLERDAVDAGAEPDRTLIDDGHLIEAVDSGSGDEPTQADIEKRARELDVPERTKMSAEQLRAAVADAEAPTQLDEQEKKRGGRS